MRTLASSWRGFVGGRAIAAHLRDHDRMAESIERVYDLCQRADEDGVEFNPAAVRAALARKEA